MINDRYTTLLKILVFLPLLLAIGYKTTLFILEHRSQMDAISNVSCVIKIIDKNYHKGIHAARYEIRAMMQECRIPGMSVTISKKGRIIWSEGFGYADIAQRKFACPGTQFRVNSVSKPFTALATIKLVEEGRLNLDEDIRHYLPEFPEKGHKITASYLATHRSGIRSYRNDEEAIQTRHFSGVMGSLDLFQDDPLLFKPGTGFHYSAYGYVLLSAVIERASGKPFLDYMKTEIFDPLSMSSTAPATNDGSLPTEASYYDHTTPYSIDGSLVISPVNDFSYKWASGGFVSTTEDLSKFGYAHITSSNQCFIDKMSIKRLFRPATKQMSLIGYAMGWMTARDVHGRKVYFHFGAGSGGTSVLAIYPEQELVMAILCNLGHAKFPFNRLSGIINSFAWSPGQMISALIILIYCLYFILRLSSPK